jgi:diketogulonate reductase-like aldo/keto reductase
MEKLVETGKARSIGTGVRKSTAKDIQTAKLPDPGLSNFNILKTKRILEIATIVPAVNQVEIHP